MDFKGRESDLMAYLYGEMEGKEKASFEQYLLDNPEARIELEKLRGLSRSLAGVEDKEVIAPPIFVGDHRGHHFWEAPYFKTVMSIAASLLIVLMVGRFSGLQLRYNNKQLMISFGAVAEPSIESTKAVPTLTSLEVQDMINASMQQNNLEIKKGWSETQQKLDASVKRNLALNSGKIDNLIRESSEASQEQIQQFVAGLQAENMKMVKNYFQLTSTEQKQYIESLLVDFAKYLQQQRNDDLQVVQTKLNSMQQNTDLFKQETEQILTSIITTVGTKRSIGTKN